LKHIDLLTKKIIFPFKFFCKAKWFQFIKNDIFIFCIYTNELLLFWFRKKLNTAQPLTPPTLSKYTCSRWVKINQLRVLALFWPSVFRVFALFDEIQLKVVLVDPFFPKVGSRMLTLVLWIILPWLQQKPIE